MRQEGGKMASKHHRVMLYSQEGAFVVLHSVHIHIRHLCASAGCQWEAVGADEVCGGWFCGFFWPLMCLREVGGRCRGWWQGSSGQGCWGVCWRGMGLISSWGLRTPLWACWAVTGVQWVAELALVDGTHLGMAPLSLWASGVASTLFSVHLGIVKGFKTPQGSGVRVRVGMSIPLQNP